MKTWIVRTTSSALAAVCLAWGNQTLADGHCVTIAHDIASGEKLSMDPSINFGLDAAGLLGSVYDALVDFDNGFNLIPRLALSWESNADATEWTYKLRQGVKFHDGSDFDAADVVHTYKRLLDPEIGSPGKAGLESILADIEVVDTHTVRFIMKQPTATAPILLKSKWAFIVPEGRPASSWTDTGSAPGRSFRRPSPRAARSGRSFETPTIGTRVCPKPRACGSP